MKPKKAAIVSALILTVILTGFQMLTLMTQPPEDRSFISLRVDWSEKEIANKLTEAGFAEEEFVFFPVNVTTHPLYVFFNTLGSVALLLLANAWLKKKLCRSKKTESSSGKLIEKRAVQKSEPDEMFPNADL